MKEYLKPEIIIVDFSTEEIADQDVVSGGGAGMLPNSLD